MMQVASVAGDQPWCCTVYYVVDEDLNLYWASIPSRRHSQEIHEHSKVAAAIPVQHDIGKKVIGLQVEGTAKKIESGDLDINPIAKKYAQRFGRDEQWVEDFSNGKTEHRLYKLEPNAIVLFDEVNFAGDPRKVWQLSKQG